MKKGSKMTEEHKRKLREARKMLMTNPEFRKKMSESHKGQIAWNKGLTKETDNRMKKISDHLISIGGFNRGKSWNKGIKTGQTPWNKGKILSEEHRIKLSESHKGKSTKNKGVPLSDERRKQHSEYMKNFYKTHIHPAKGRKSSEETRKKLSESHKGQIAWNKGIPLLKELIERRQKTIIKKWEANPELRKKRIEKSRRTILKLYESGSFPKQTNTLPERMIKEELIKRGYKEETDFIHQYKFMDKFMCDFCFPNQRLIIEVDGDFWHCNPAIYPKPIHPHQKKGVGRDKSKEAYIRKVDNGSWDLIILWERDIKKDVSKCVDKIEEALRKKRELTE